MKTMLTINEPIDVVIVFEEREDDTHVEIVNAILSALEPVREKYNADGESRVRNSHNTCLEPGEHFLTKAEEKNRCDLEQAAREALQDTTSVLVGNVKTRPAAGRRDG